WCLRNFNQHLLLFSSYRRLPFIPPSFPANFPSLLNISSLRREMGTFQILVPVQLEVCVSFGGEVCHLGLLMTKASTIVLGIGIAVVLRTATYARISKNKINIQNKDQILERKNIDGFSMIDNLLLLIRTENATNEGSRVEQVELLGEYGLRNLQKNLISMALFSSGSMTLGNPAVAAASEHMKMNPVYEVGELFELGIQLVVRGWRKTGRLEHVSLSFTEVQAIRCTINDAELVWHAEYISISMWEYFKPGKIKKFHQIPEEVASPALECRHPDLAVQQNLVTAESITSATTQYVNNMLPSVGSTGTAPAPNHGVGCTTAGIYFNVVSVGSRYASTFEISKVEICLRVVQDIVREIWPVFRPSRRCSIHEALSVFPNIFALEVDKHITVQERLGSIVLGGRGFGNGN
ncbi:hypothetical protein M8C21_022013, partial [Ambrosia artemisiifolia]